MKCRLVDLSFDLRTKKQKIIIELDGDFRRDFDDLNGKDLELTLKPWKKRRSLNANAYMWKLVHELALRMNLPDEEVYRLAIKAVGIWKDFPPLPKREAETLKVAWRGLGEGWIAEQIDYDEDGESVVVRCWYGSSVYDTQQMSRLLDYIISDCKALGIETMTPAELAALKGKWKGAKI